jgi:hypothetical protein
MDDRREFLLEMYRQMFADINRHMTVVWQAVSVVVGAFAILALVEKNVIPVDIAVALIVILCTWMYAHMLDGGYWYNRNLAMISNIERQFLVSSDLKEIQYYFGKHRSKKNKMISYFRVQAGLAVAIASLVILFHFVTRVLPGFHETWSSFEPARALPYISAAAAVGVCFWFARDRQKAYQNFLANSPGLTIDTSSVTYGTGHTVDN